VALGAAAAAACAGKPLATWAAARLWCDDPVRAVIFLSTQRSTRGTRSLRFGLECTHGGEGSRLDALNSTGFCEAGNTLLSLQRGTPVTLQLGRGEWVDVEERAVECGSWTGRPLAEDLKCELRGVS
jgi:hypothetical protein